MQNPFPCPACSTSMTSKNFGAIHAEVCEGGCSRIWFDAGELERVDHHSKGAGPALEEAVSEVAESVESVDGFDCPRCSEPLDRAEYELETSVVIDECPNCAGILLDPGELAGIRNRKLTGTEARRVRRRVRKRNARKRAREEAARMNAMTAAFLIVSSY